MKLRFTKMQGAGNDFVVIDATRAPLVLSPAQLQRLGDRRFGVGADQILVVERSATPGIDFRYRIFNGGSGEEVEQCGNGARCFVRYVHDHHLSEARRIRVETLNRQLELHLQPDGRVTVDMGEPDFEPAHLPFDGAAWRRARRMDWPCGRWTSPTVRAARWPWCPWAIRTRCSGWTMPTPPMWPASARRWKGTHASRDGSTPASCRCSRAPQVRLRVYERGAGETLACGTGACAAVVAGIRLGWLDAAVDVHTRGGLLSIAWAGPGHTVRMTGPAETVFEGEIDLPD